MKKCFKCGLEKPLTEYYTHKKMKDGHLNKCKVCTRNDSKLRTDALIKNETWLENEKERQRDKYFRLSYKEKHKKSKEIKNRDIKKYNDKYPEKRKAKNLSQRIRPLKKGNHMHHWSYKLEHATDVIELTPKQHSTIHRFIVYDNITFMYKIKKSLILLDSREKHENFINYIINLNRL